MSESPESESPDPVRAHRFGDHVDTDQIIPAAHLVTTDQEELGRHCMSGSDPGFAARVNVGDVLIAGRNFGCGSSREHAPIALLGCGVRAIVAVSFARIFFRNAINLGLAVLECPEAAAEIQDGAEVAIDEEAGTIEDLGSGRRYQAAPLPAIALEIRAAGGLMPWALSQERT